MISYFFEDIDKIEPPPFFSGWLNRTAKEFDVKFKLNYIFCSDDFILQLNKKHLDHNYYTDILTFDLSDNESDTIEADIFISLDTVKSNSQSLSTKFDHELLRVMSHGVFHLLGYGDTTEEEKNEMRKLEEEVLAQIV